ncbi:hypothetical protein GCM10009634_82850 [Saccharothrix xinjiangensis]
MVEPRTGPDSVRTAFPAVAAAGTAPATSPNTTSSTPSDRHMSATVSGATAEDINRSVEIRSAGRSTPRRRA